MLPAAQLPRRVDHTDTVGSALLAAANGQGHRRIAAELELPADTVRGWLRRFRAQADVLHGLAVRFAFSSDPGFQPPSPERSPFADAVAALDRAAAAAVRRLGLRSTFAWQIILMITRGGYSHRFPEAD